jgi:hypothetical protein
MSSQSIQQEVKRIISRIHNVSNAQRDELIIKLFQHYNFNPRMLTELTGLSKQRISQILKEAK